LSIWPDAIINKPSFRILKIPCALSERALRVRKLKGPYQDGDPCTTGLRAHSDWPRNRRRPRSVTRPVGGLCGLRRTVHHVQTNLPTANATTHPNRNKKIETAKVGLLLKLLEPFVDARRSLEKDRTNEEKKGDSGGDEGYDLENHCSVLSACTYREQTRSMQMICS
jgi:hypothetical protein